MKNSTNKTLLSHYTRAAAEHGKATRAGDYETANRQYEIIAGVCRALRTRGPDAQQELLTLLDDDDADVRLWAATHALEFAPIQGESVLEEIGRSGGTAAFSAEMTLKEWRKSTLQFP